IGFQNQTGTEGFQLHYGSTSSDAPFPGGLAGRSFRADPKYPAGQHSVTGVQVNPPAAGETITYTACIRDEDWVECKEAVIDVLRTGDLQISEVMPLPANGGAEWLEI